MDFQTLGRDVAISHLDAMGLDCDKSADGVKFKLGECRFDVQEMRALNGGSSAVLDLDFAVGDTVVKELLVSVGQNDEEAIVRGVCDWMCGMVAPVIALYEPIDLKKWGLRKVSIMSSTGDRYRNWDVVLGQVMTNDQDGFIEQELERNPPFGMALNAVTERLHEEQLHWAKVFLMRAEKAGISGEVRVDNEIDQASNKQLQAFRWPLTTQPLVWFRQFAALLPGEEVTEADFQALMAQTRA